MTCGIYLIENKKTKQKYVGQSIHIEKRWQEHCRGKNISSSYIDKAIRKHGKDNFILKIITELPNNINVLNQHEKYWINFYNTFDDDNHYNLTIGGNGVGSGKNSPMYNKKHTKETLNKMSLAQSGEKNAMYGKHHSKETREKLSKLNSGKNNAMYGKRHSQELQNKISLTRSKTTNNVGYYRVSKKKSKSCNQGFIWQYRYTDTDGKRKTIMSINFDKLKDKVLKRKLPWYKL